jgi:hypothetical protein
MKIKEFLLALICGAALVGCDQGDQPEPGQEPPTGSMSERLSDAADASRDAAVQGKDQFVAVMETQLQEMDSNIVALSEKTQDLGADAKAQAGETLEKLREEQMEVREKYNELKAAGAEQWEDVKAGFESAMSKLEQTYQNAKSQFEN